MENTEKGCVYFFKHVGLSPIKIGYTNNPSPIKRFEAFKVYAPFGAQLIGFIISENPIKLESLLHQKYSRDRINGEWFEITEEEAEKCIKFYSNIYDIEEKNRFQIDWAKKNEPKIEKMQNYPNNFFDYYSFEKRKGYEKVITNQSEISIFLKCEKKEVADFLELNSIKYKTYRVNGIIKKGYFLYIKDYFTNDF